MESSDNIIMTTEQTRATNSTTAVVRAIRIASRTKNPAKASAREDRVERKPQMSPSRLLLTSKPSPRARSVTRLLILALATTISPLIITMHRIKRVKRSFMVVAKETRIDSKRRNNANDFAEDSKGKVKSSENS